ncbi:hypothetical protein AA98_2356 [Escherichia coli 2-011-08_S1_C1]|nr:hypothetical protein AA98_2356 [Escherichia coli 2-011-08_S1_C1]
MVMGKLAKNQSIVEITIMRYIIAWIGYHRLELLLDKK